MGYMKIIEVVIRDLYTGKSDRSCKYCKNEYCFKTHISNVRMAQPNVKVSTKRLNLKSAWKWSKCRSVPPL